MARLLVLAFCVACSLCVTGCGGGGQLSKEDYQQEVKGIGQDLVDSGKQLASATSVDSFVSGLDDLQGALNKAADDLDSLNPPEDAKAANDKLASALRSLADGFDSVKAAAKDGFEKARTAATVLLVSQAARAAQEAVQALKRLNYEIGELGLGTG